MQAKQDRQDRRDRQDRQDRQYRQDRQDTRAAPFSNSSRQALLIRTPSKVQTEPSSTFLCAEKVTTAGRL